MFQPLAVPLVAAVGGARARSDGILLSFCFSRRGARARRRVVVVPPLRLVGIDARDRSG
jgi:hypothetical protein